ncbi:twin arginine-targeting protein translocase TatB [Thioalkalivibrio denitrificans]|uniref:Sec-independent protein translocase protein TatB n=1 Tax=Thioalkalivibrio denitrificans TaxID=108003 RepID=A0A1V3NCZ0_9GAMM|nr:Sec-independent protein translocase protein TatB [Thioalkalivibrio denitrificans]OOG22967.1 twin arginine-targeting protein translocase TatB [Thioalkalivibrio denitrificans]
MFDIGFWEILIILLVALLVVGPDRLPGLAREAGLWVRKMRSFVSSVRSDIEQEFQTEELRKLLNEQNKEISQLKDMMKDTEESLRSEVEETSYLVKSIEKEVKDEPDASTGGDFESEATELVKQRKADASEKTANAPSTAETPPARKDRDESQS